MRTSSPTKSGLPSLVASTLAATAAGRSLAPITFAASRIAAPASRPPSVTTSATSPPGVTSVERRSRSSGRAPTSTKSAHAAAPLDQVLDEIEQQRLGPLQVVDHQHDGPGLRERAQHAAHHEEGLLGRGRRSAEQGRDAAGDARAIGVFCRQRGFERRAQRFRARAVLDAEQLAQRLGERREGGATGDVATGAHHRRGIGVATRELVDQARLAEPRRAEQHGEPRRRLLDRRLVHRSETRELLVAADEGRRRRAGRALERHDAVRLHRFGAALQREAAEQFERDERGHEPVRRLSDHDVTVPTLLLQASRHVHRIADDLRLVVRDDLAGVHRDAQTGRADGAALLFRERVEGFLHRDGGAHRADRVILRDARNPEHRLHAVARAAA